jgi:hypothetical protein
MPEHRGFEYGVDRVENGGSGYKYEFVLRVEGQGEVITATELERRGADGPEDDGDNWTAQLEDYALGYIDGLEAGMNA